MKRTPAALFAARGIGIALTVVAIALSLCVREVPRTGAAETIRQQSRVARQSPGYLRLPAFQLPGRPGIGRT